MKICSIHIYNHNGKRRDVNFDINGLNIITGKSGTGKSSLINIVEYCLGRSKFLIPAGTYFEKIAWYGVLYQFDNQEQVFICKPSPKRESNSCSTGMIIIGKEIVIPNLSELKINTSDDTIISVLSRMLGIPETKTDVSEDESRPSFNVNIKHTQYYIFQPSEVLAGRKQLFYRQDEEYQPTTIRDTLPIILGAMPNDYLKMKNELRRAKRDLKIEKKRDDDNKINQFDEEKRAKALFSEATTVGLIDGGEINNLEYEELLGVLNNGKEWTPKKIMTEEGNEVIKIEEELRSTRRKRTDLYRKLEAARLFMRRGNAYKNEATEQKGRLETIKALPFSETGEWQWPFSEQNLGFDTPIAQTLLKELNSLSDEINVATKELPRLENYVMKLEEDISELTEHIKVQEQQLADSIEANETLEKMRDHSACIARVVGRISFFLENYLPASNDDDQRREEYIRSLKRKILTLENLISEKKRQTLLASILDNISNDITEYIRFFDAEHAKYPARFDLANLTIKFDRPEGPIEMKRTGSAENHLIYHLATLLALHAYCAYANRPLPKFIFLDQPSQVYFPEDKYEDANGSIETTEKDADLEAIENLFKFLLDYTKSIVPGFQIIVTEHANLKDEWFQNALVEEPWRKPPALIPDDF